MKLLTKTLALLAMTTIGLNAVAQSAGGFDLQWNTCDGSGGSCAGGAFTLSGTIGQPDAGFSSGASFSLAGGFWPGIEEAPPWLRVEPYNGFVIVAWPGSFTGFSLQENPDLRTRNWTTVATTPVEFNGEKLVLLPATASARFFRLAKP